MSSSSRCVEDTIARRIAVAMKPHGGRIPGLIRPLQLERYGSRHIRCLSARTGCMIMLLPPLRRTQLTVRTPRAIGEPAAKQEFKGEDTVPRGIA
jgi:hypothetical protein